MSLIATAYAASTPAAPQAPGISSFLFLIGFIVIFYFLLWRPQSKRAKEQREMIAKLSVGDEVVTAGGIIGTINKVSDDFLIIQIAENVKVKLQKPSVSTTLPKGTYKSIEQ